MSASTKPKFNWSVVELFKLYLYVCVLVLLILHTPNQIWNGTLGKVTITLGVLGIWRYLWWFTHFVRAQIYERLRYPKIRRRATALWNSGWRPERVHFMMTTYMEHPETCNKVILSIVRELMELGVPGTLMIGTASKEDEDVLTRVIEFLAKDVDLDVYYVRQNAPGKRIAIGLALRALCRKGVHGNDPVVFIDGDSILEPGCLRRCIPIFELYPRVHALTTYETAIVFGHKWMRRWLDMRFAQRHMVMQSHALSWKVLTLTGRMSVFRAHNVIKEDFINTVECDHLDHWLWGRFQFLSGDDKSSWFWMIKARAQMLYIPDARVHTVERVESGTWDRAVQNAFRWSGNMLRNGARVIALGPRRVGPFIWWCVVDQRLAMWTAIAGITAMTTAGLFVSPLAFWAFAIWVLMTRLFFSLALFYYARRIDMSFPFVLYANQVGLALIKIYIVFRLPFQRWSNRGDQRMYDNGKGRWRVKRWIATYITLVWLTGFLLFLFFYVGLLEPPTVQTVRLFWDTFQR